MKIFKKFFPGAPIKQIIIGCIIDGSSYTCELENGEKCGLLCGLEHGEYIYFSRKGNETGSR